MLTKENYREYDAVNVSKLSTLDRNPSAVNKDVEQHEGLTFGSLVDDMCFEPSSVKDKYYRSTAYRKPSKTAKKLADWILDTFNVHDIVNHTIITPSKDYNLKTLLKQAKKKVGSSTNFKKYGGLDYLKEQIQSKDKIVVSDDLWQLANQAKMVLKTHPFTKDYFYSPERHIEIKFQVPILWEPKVFNPDLTWTAKSLLDIVILNANTMEATPVDLKTTGKSVFSFPSTVVKWRYYLQASYYWYALNCELDNKWTINPFEFVVIGKNDVTTPLVYTMTKEDLITSAHGGTLKSWNVETKGWMQLLKDLDWHNTHDKWDYKREVYENNGKVELDIFE